MYSQTSIILYLLLGITSLIAYEFGPLISFPAKNNLIKRVYANSLIAIEILQTKVSVLSDIDF